MKISWIEKEPGTIKGYVVLPNCGDIVCIVIVRRFEHRWYANSVYQNLYGGPFNEEKSAKEWANIKVLQLLPSLQAA